MTDKVESEAVSEGEVCIIVIDSGCVHMEPVVVHCVGMCCYLQYNGLGACMLCVCVCACWGVHLLFSTDWQSSWENEASAPAANGTTSLVASCWLTH